MAASTTSLVYALPIRAGDLIAAACVYSKLGPTSLGLRLAVAALERENALTSALGGKIPAINRVPVELWEMVFQELIDAEMRSTRVELMEIFYCASCDEERLMEYLYEERGDEDKTIDQMMEEDKDDRRPAQESRVWEREWIDLGTESSVYGSDCDSAAARRSTWLNLADEQLKTQAATKLLASYGLTISTTKVIHTDETTLDRSDSVVFIAADLEKHEHAFAVPAKVVNEIDRHGANNSNVKTINLGTDFFDKHDKLNLDNRFNRFCSTYSVTAHHAPMPPEAVAPAGAAAAGAPPPAAGALGPNAPAAAVGGGGAQVAILGTDSDDDGGDQEEKEEKPKPGWIILSELTRT